MRRIDPDEMEAAIADYLESGDPARTVAKRHPVTDERLRAELKAKGLTRNSGGHVHPRVRTAALTDVRNGMTINATAKKHGVSRASVSTWLTNAEATDDPDELAGGVWVNCGGIMRWEWAA